MAVTVGALGRGAGATGEAIGAGATGAGGRGAGVGGGGVVCRGGGGVGEEPPEGGSGSNGRFDGGVAILLGKFARSIWIIPCFHFVTVFEAVSVCIRIVRI